MAQEFNGFTKHFNSTTKQGRFGAAVGTLSLVASFALYKKATGGGSAKVKQQPVAVAVAKPNPQ